MLNWIICGWLVGAAVSWIGIMVHWRKLLGLSWKDYVQRWAFGLREIPKAILYVTIWPVDVWAVVHNAMEIKRLRKELENDFCPY